MITTKETPTLGNPQRPEGITNLISSLDVLRTAGKVLVYVFLLATLIYVLKPRMICRVENAPVSAALSGLHSIKHLLAEYASEHAGKFPASLADLPRPPDSKTETLPDSETIDPWGTTYVYEAKNMGESYSLFSCGTDKKPGTKDDITIEDLMRAQSVASRNSAK
ncbi:MAG: type II secretion system protein GspG [Candidatus Hydrogenedentales bacterium]